ncbi:MAG: hemerythrin domain-containing protein [Polyangia bacterium]
MNAIKLLDQQHDEVSALFKKIDAAKGNAKVALFDQVADALAIHCTIEEKIFYPAVFGANTEDLLMEAVEEHLGAKRLIADLLSMTPDDPHYQAKCAVLSEQVAHHVKEERAELFTKARRLLDEDQLEALGQEMQAQTLQLQNTNARRAVPAQTAHAAELRHGA